MNNFKIEKAFISDLHLGNCFVDMKLLETFLKRVKKDKIELHLIGDVFDAWRHVHPDKAAKLFDGISSIVYIAGNHDHKYAKINPFHEVAKNFSSLMLGKNELLVTHGHLFDPNFKDTGIIGRIADEYVYLLSKLLGKDLRTYITSYANAYSKKIEFNAATNEKMKNLNYAIIGHTHKGGHRVVNGKNIFNLGSWLTEPWGLFTSGEKFAFQKIETSNVFPSEKDFHDLR